MIYFQQTFPVKHNPFTCPNRRAKFQHIPICIPLFLRCIKTVSLSRKGFQLLTPPFLLPPPSFFVKLFINSPSHVWAVEVRLSSNKSYWHSFPKSFSHKFCAYFLLCSSVPFASGVKENQWYLRLSSFTVCFRAQWSLEIFSLSRIFFSFIFLPFLSVS